MQLMTNTHGVKLHVSNMHNVFNVRKTFTNTGDDTQLTKKALM